jgi:AcrR family transcriptional regulator
MGEGKKTGGAAAGGDAGRAAPKGGRQAVVTRVLDAAEQLFSDHPYADVSVRAIGDAAGVSHALVHRYVGAKADILRGVLARHEGVMARSAAGAGTVREAAGLMLAGDARATQRYFRLVLRFSMDSVLREVTGVGFEATRLLAGLAERQSAAAEGEEQIDPGLAVAAAVSLVVGFAGLRDAVLREVGLADTGEQEIDAQIRQIVDRLLAATVAEPPGATL